MTALSFSDWLSSPEAIQRLGWVLIHSLWQFTFIALLAVAALRVPRPNASSQRYGILLVAILSVVVLPAVTWYQLAQTQSVTALDRIFRSEDNGSVALDAESLTMESDGENAELPANAFDHVAYGRGWADARQSRPANRSSAFVPGQRPIDIQPWLGWVVLAWSFGVVILSARLLFGWYTLHRLRRVGITHVSDEIQIRLTNVSRTLRLRRSVQVAQSSLAQVPIVIGYIRPLILLPLSLATSLPNSQLEAILAHELAHVRRHDFFVNLIQSLIEALFFYHPAVWWLSHQLRIEREHCCDDTVMKFFDNRVEYGRALVAIEELRGPIFGLELSSGGGSLLSRIRRITSPPAVGTRTKVRCSAFALSLILVIGYVTLFSSAINVFVVESGAQEQNEDRAFRAGEVEARRDIADGKRKYKLYGRLSAADRRVLLEHRIEIETLSDDSQVEVRKKADGYNHAILKELFGKTRDGQSEEGTLKTEFSGGTELADHLAPTDVFKPQKPALVFPDHLNVMAVGFDQEGETLVTVATETDVTVRTWDLAGRKLKREVKLESDKHGNMFLQAQLTLSGDRQRVLAILDGSVTIWDANSGKLVKTLAPPPPLSHSMLRGLTVTPDMSLVACGVSPAFSGIDVATAKAIVWDVKTGRVLRTVSHPRAIQIQSIALSPDAKYIATGGQEAGVCVWDVRTGNLLYQLPNDNEGKVHPSPEVTPGGANQVLCLRFSPDSQRLVLGDMLGVKMLEASTGKRIFQCEAAFRYGRSGIVFSRNGRLFARIATDKTVPIWSAETGKLVAELAAESNDGVFSDDNRSFAVGTSDANRGLSVWPLSGSDTKSKSTSHTTPPTDATDKRLGEGGATEGGVQARAKPVDVDSGAEGVTAFVTGQARQAEASGNSPELLRSVKRDVKVQILAGDTQKPLEGLDVSFTRGHGANQEKFGPWRTDKEGCVQASFVPGTYELRLQSNRELAYLPVDDAWTRSASVTSPWLVMNVTDTNVGKWTPREAYQYPGEGADPWHVSFSLIPACELILKAVDEETGQGLAGVEFYEENAAGEEWAHVVYSRNIGPEFSSSHRVSPESNVTDKNGVFRRYVGQLGDHIKFGIDKSPPGYRPSESASEVSILTRFGQRQAEQVFKLKRIR